MFLFPEATAAVRAALEMSEGAPGAGPPTTHIGIQSGPVVFQDGDVYGRTVNLAFRIADLAEAGARAHDRGDQAASCSGASETSWASKRTFCAVTPMQ
jgi:class 3 adenylate cyclase